ncbi:flagellar brake protein [Halanaerobium praevalens]|uniref:Type IV pilus assembly PilZ n=1 Tax=Halanaerobium praevalens (strain ATCC 33744 / DSM 2228 / GSL) TaxID=572479 RepID=E3DPP6_HALPG|nr:flagellar brake protein [Halanaerobium praevalens]ADO76721.1 type IV pilus assembly PilZ [Halanaerobium praevalens DSM 2228]
MKELNVNQKLEIEILSGTYQGNYLTKVADFLDEGIIITGLYREGAPLPVRLKQPIIVYYTTDRAAYKFKSKILKRTNKPIPLLLIESSDSVTRIQRRDYFRLDVTGTVDVYKMQPKKGYPRKLSEARLLDISGGGIQMQLKKKFELGEELLISLKDILPPKEFIKSEIVRVQKENEELYNYGVNFLEVEAEQREEIIQWIFAYQRKTRKKGLR